ncbi:MAG: alpha/beta fold hydrolase [Dehalococcoidia bacterium]|nr:alpha/beta fold hydrolase [Dehalococcoidia bacterium]
MPVTEASGATIAYEAAGQGPPLLLVMGYGLPGSAWALMLPYLSGFQVAYFDNRGTGGSRGAPVGRISEFIPTAAGDALAVMDALGWQSAHVFGISMGGMIAQEVALRAPERVRSLVLGCTSCGEPGPTEAQRETIRELQRGMSLMATAPEECARVVLPLSFPAAYLAAHPEVVSLTAMAFKAMPTAAVPAIEGEELNGWRSADRLGEIRTPALVLHGAEDRLIPVAHGYRLFEGLPNAELRVIKGAGHSFTAHDPAGTLHGVAVWLQAREAAVGRK